MSGPVGMSLRTAGWKCSRQITCASFLQHVSPLFSLFLNRSLSLNLCFSVAPSLLLSLKRIGTHFSRFHRDLSKQLLRCFCCCFFDLKESWNSVAIILQIMQHNRKPETPTYTMLLLTDNARLTFRTSHPL